MHDLVRLAAVACAAFALATGAALAQTRGSDRADGFRICNNSGQDAEAATAVDLGDEGGTPGTYLSKGWYQFDAGQCIVMWPGTLQHRYFLVYAQNKQAGREWKGDIPVCVSREPFDLRSAACAGDRYSRMFVRIDTGTSASWTYTLLP